MRSSLIIGESKRLEALENSGVLGTLPEPFFEDVVDSVQCALAVPYSVISFVGVDWQYFRARRGISADGAPRAPSLTARAIENDSTLTVSDLRLDVSFRDKEVVTSGPQLRAYAGALIRLQGGACIGAVCALDKQRRDWTSAEVAHLERNARMLGRYIDARRAYLEQDRHRFLEAALTRAELRYKSVLSSMAEGVIVHGLSGAIIDSNPAAAEMLGLSEDELFGRACQDPVWRSVRANGEPFPGEEHPAVVTLRTGEPQHNVIMGVDTPSGEQRWLSINSFPVRRPSDGRLDQVIVTIRRIDRTPIDLSSYLSVVRDRR